MNPNFSWRDLHIGYVNLSHREDRRELMERELSRVGLSAERFEALKTKDEGWNVEPYKKMYARTPGAIGCMLSQMYVMKIAYERGKGAMVLEDDLVFASDTTKRLDYIENFINTKEPETDLVFLGGTVHVNPCWWHGKEHEGVLQPYCSCNLERDAERTEDERMIRVYGMFSTHAYFVPYDKIPKILDLLNEVMSITIGIDFSLIIHQPNLKCFAFMPGTVKQYNALSDIGNGWTMFEHFAVLGAHWWQDDMNNFNPETYNWGEAHKR